MAEKLVALLAAYMPEWDRKVLPQSWTEFEKRLSEVVDTHEGHVINIVGDGWFVAEFSNALTGVQCAVDIQLDLKEAVAEPTAMDQAQLHIGVNYEPPPRPGQVWPSTRDDSADRLAALAELGGICLSRTVYDEIRFKINLPFDTMRDPKHTAFVCQEIRRKLGSLNLLESGAVRLGAAALRSRNVRTSAEDTTSDSRVETFKKIRAYFRSQPLIARVKPERRLWANMRKFAPKFRHMRFSPHCRMKEASICLCCSPIIALPNQRFSGRSFRQ